MATQTPPVILPQGTIHGTRLTPSSGAPQVDAFLGIPYAKPPLGDLRFRHPQKLPDSNEDIDASKYGPAAPGKALLPGPATEQSEDCLTVNIFRPLNAPAEKKLPVAIYVHGGAYNRGSAAMHKTASMVAASSGPFIAVSFGYRIGALGFLPSSLSQKEGALNLGLRDQIFLFEWVQSHIGEFGGDEKCVTLFGLSAGAHSIGHHILNPKTSGLYHRAILESGSPTSRAVRPYDASIHEAQFQDFLSEVKCPPDTPESEIFNFLRSLPTKTITDAQTAVFDMYNPSLRWAFQPVIDGDTIPRKPLDAWEAGDWVKVPIMTGFNSNEGTMYVDKSMSRPDQFRGFWKELLPQLTKGDLDTIDSLYPDPGSIKDSSYIETREGQGLGEQYKRIEAAYGHYAYVAPVRQTAEFASAAEKKTKVPVYLYHWALPRTVIGRANHGDNMYYETFNDDITSISPSQKKLSGTLHAYITSFIVSGDPNAIPGSYKERPKWEEYNPVKPGILVFGQNNEELIGGGTAPPAKFVGDEWARRETEFWWSKVEISQVA